MSEAEAIARATEPSTVESLSGDFAALGLRAGDIALVHSSLSALGWVAGGPVAVIDALCGVLGSRGTLVMPSHSGGLSEPSHWVNPPVPPSWWPVIRSSMPAFDKARTPTCGMGQIAELFRTLPNVMRSEHPTLSMAAFGPAAAEITRQHPLDDPLGPESPLGRLYELNAKVLLVGVGHDRNTSLHLAERKAFPRRKRIQAGSPLILGGQRQWVEYAEPEIDSDDFESVGAAFESETSDVTIGRIGVGAGRMMLQRKVVDFGVGWFGRNRSSDGHPSAQQQVQ